MCVAAASVFVLLTSKNRIFVLVSIAWRRRCVSCVGGRNIAGDKLFQSLRYYLAAMQCQSTQTEYEFFCFLFGKSHHEQ